MCVHEFSFEREKAKHTDLFQPSGRQKIDFNLPVLLPMIQNRQDWARPKAANWNSMQFYHMVAGTHVCESASAGSQCSLYQESQSEAEYPELKPGT